MSIAIFIILITEIITKLFIYKYDDNYYRYCTSQLSVLNMIYSILIILVVLNIEKLYRSNILFRALEKIGDNSYGIYFVHVACIIVLNKLISSLSINVFVYYFIETILVTLISYYGIKLFKLITKNKFDRFLGF